MDSTGKLVMESILETEAATILQFFAGLRGTLSVTFEEGTWSVWLYDLLNPHVDKLVVCNPRKNALLKDGNKSDRIDARKLAELLRGNQLKPVYHGETGVRMLRELSSPYIDQAISLKTPDNQAEGHTDAYSIRIFPVWFLSKKKCWFLFLIASIAALASSDVRRSACFTKTESTGSASARSEY